MPNYENSKIYKLWSPSKNLVYYGSTTETLSRRLSGHLTGYNRHKNNNTTAYVNSFKILECEDYKIELVEEYPCNNKQQLCKKEGEYIKANECVNKLIAGRTKQEWYKENPDNVAKKNKKYADNNKEKIKAYNDANADKIKEYKRQWYLKQKEIKIEKI
jgi:hypothetical protein